MRKALVFCASVLFGFVAIYAAQTPKPPRSRAAFVLNANKPFVYLEFVKVEQKPVSEEYKVEGTLYLRLMNNCRVPINVQTYSGNHIVHEVVYDPSALSNPMMPKLWDMPNEGAPDVRNQRTVASGQTLIVTVPIDNVSSAWHIEVPFEFALSPTTCCEPEPRMNALFEVEGIPETSRSVFLRRNR